MSRSIHTIAALDVSFIKYQQGRSWKIKKYCIIGSLNLIYHAFLLFFHWIWSKIATLDQPSIIQSICIGDEIQLYGWADTYLKIIFINRAASIFASWTMNCSLIHSVIMMELCINYRNIHSAATSDVAFSIKTTRCKKGEILNYRSWDYRCHSYIIQAISDQI